MADFWFRKRVFITGHTGFKGAWLAYWLSKKGAIVSGLALKPATQPNLFELLKLRGKGYFIEADINDELKLREIMEEAKPEVVLHLAAQALVRESYKAPIETFKTNVIGVASILNVVRQCDSVRAVVIVTSDKAYENKEWIWGYREFDELGGFDPYSASKGCAELVTSSMRRSYFGPKGHQALIASVRAGNVIGGGDWSQDRLLPDIIRSCLSENADIVLRNPTSVRPWQHVLEPLNAYLMLAERLYRREPGFDGAWNIGPDPRDNRSVLEVAHAMTAALGRGHVAEEKSSDGPHEAGLLTLDCSKALSKLGWKGKLCFQETIAFTAEWYARWALGDDAQQITNDQIEKFEKHT